MNSQNKVVYGLLITLIGATFSLWLMLFEPPWLSYPVLPLPVVQKVVQQGDVVPLRVIRCNSSSRKQTYTIARSVVSVEVGGGTYPMDDIVTFIEPGCQKVISTAHRVPVAVAPGKYQLVAISEVHGTLRTSFVEWTSEPFTVEALP